MPKRPKSLELLDFEIQFYERLVQDHPEFVDALIALGEAYTRRGWHEKGLATDLRLTQLTGKNPIVWYNLACSYSLLRRPEEALQALRQSITLGYDDFAYLGQDPDLETLRRSPQFRQFLETLAPKPR